MKCSICNKHIEPVTDRNGAVVFLADGVTPKVFGHNADPVTDGRCCDSCNTTVVIPARLGTVVPRPAASL